MKNADDRNTKLGETLYRLRQNIDIHRLIGLNAGELNNSEMPKEFLGHVQNLALQSIALDISKIYEAHNKRYELNSIPYIIASLSTHKFTEQQILFARKFVRKHGLIEDNISLPQVLEKSLQEFTKHHTSAIDRLKNFRDKFAAHSEHGFKPESLPGTDSFEALFVYASDFYSFISERICDVKPAPIGRQASMSLYIYLKNTVRLPNLRYDS
jgi:hypothetical protein